MNRCLRACSSLLLGAAFLILPLSGCDNTNNDETLLLRVIHAASGVPSIEFLIDFDLFTRNLSFRNASPYTQWEAGLRRLEVRTDQGGLTREVLFQPEGIHTILVTSLDEPADLVVLDDDRSTPPSGQARVRVVNVTSNIDALSLQITPDDQGSALDATVSGFGATSAFLSVDAGAYTFSGRALDGSLSLPPLALTLENGRRYLIVATTTAMFSVADG